MNLLSLLSPAVLCRGLYVLDFMCSDLCDVGERNGATPDVKSLKAAKQI